MNNKNAIVATPKELEAIKKVELDILSEFHKICEENNLKYCLIGGTMIGAVRHNGFIPWDDDIDVCMSRDDYNKFIKIHDKVLNKEKYYFQTLELSEEFGWPFGKIRRKNSVYKEWNQDLKEEQAGIWIDVFPYDKVPKNKFLTALQFIKVFNCKVMLFKKLGNTTYGNTFIKNMILKFLFFMSKFHSVNSLKKKLFKHMTKYNNLSDNYNYISYGGSYQLKEVCEPDCLDELMLHKFENKDFYIPKKYDKYLTGVYGDYMKLPPKEKQVSHHEVEKIVIPSEFFE